MTTTITKRFFVKYLPVPGPVQVGFIWDTRIYSTHENQIVEILEVDKYGNYRSKNGSYSATYVGAFPAKLFVCDRNIQAGDRVIDLYGGETWSEWTVKPSDAGNPCNLKECYKPIGQIDPTATHIGPGMELDEAELETIPFVTTHNPNKQ